MYHAKNAPRILIEHIKKKIEIKKSALKKTFTYVKTYFRSSYSKLIDGFSHLPSNYSIIGHKHKKQLS
jgi:hypothetical protein